jgi:peptidyl-prolyl cis-trans isomerase C
MKRDLPLSVIAVAAALAICFGLAKMRPDYAPTKSQPFSLDKAAPNPAAKPAPGSGHVIMRVNGEPVTEREFQTYLSGAPEQMQQMLGSAQGRRVMADQIVKLKALEQKAREMGLDRDPELTSRLDAERSNMLANAALRKLVGNDEQRLREAYEKNKTQMETVDLSHILIAYQGGQAPARGGNAPSREQAMQKANAIEMALQKGAPFAAIARQASDDTASAERGGELGPIGRDALPPEIGNAVFALKPGEVSKPVMSQYGIHIFKAGKRQSPSFEQVKPMLQQQMQQQLIGETVDKLAKGANVYLDPSFFGPEPKPGAAPAVPPAMKRPS